MVVCDGGGGGGGVGGALSDLMQKYSSFQLSVIKPKPIAITHSGQSQQIQTRQ